MTSGYGNPYQEGGYNDGGYASSYQRQGTHWPFINLCSVILLNVVAPSQVQWESIPQPPSQPSWSGNREQRQQQDGRYQQYNSYVTPQQSPHQYQPYQQQYQPYQQQHQQWEGYPQHSGHPKRTTSWSRNR